MPTGALEAAPEANVRTVGDGDCAGIGEERAHGAAVKGCSEKREGAQVYRPRGTGHGECRRE
jgi:hypothetical protein